MNLVQLSCAQQQVLYGGPHNWGRDKMAVILHENYFVFFIAMSLIQIIACPRTGDKPLPEPRLA